MLGQCCEPPFPVCIVGGVCFWQLKLFAAPTVCHTCWYSNSRGEKLKCNYLIIVFQSVSKEFLQPDLSMVNVLYRNVLIVKTYYNCFNSVKKKL